MTFRDLVFEGGQEAAATAVVGTDGSSISYGGLRSATKRLVGSMNAMGFRKDQRIALVMPNGFPMAVSLMALISGFACAPFDASVKDAELEKRLVEIRADCVVSDRRSGGRFAAVSKGLGIESIELRADRDLGLVLDGGQGECPGDPRWAGEDDIIMLMQTSGTTAKPKLVGLTDRNVCHSVNGIRDCLRLTEGDRCMCVMPLSHVHGQIMVFATVASGGEAVCAPGFDPGSFLEWLREYRPTWYSAVPTVHRAVCDLPKAELAKARGRIRFVRSASSALPVKLIRELEEAFGVPVVEAYGMTEASHGIATNPLPPSVRKPGSVGLPLPGVEVAVLGGGGEKLGRGQEGELVIRGVNVIQEYLESPEANARSFVGGWLRTGDLGFVDADGYIYITGRIKDLINRGGEKIAPREVEERLLENDAVSEAMAFSVPHPTLGEDVAAAVVLKKGHSVSEEGLRAGLLRTLSANKVPARVFVVGEIPKGAMGKPRRAGAAEALGLARPRVAPAGAGDAADGAKGGFVREGINSIWRAVLRRGEIGDGERFLEAGGDSLRAMQVASRLREAFGVVIDVSELFEADTVLKQARLVEMRMTAGERKRERGM